MGGLDTYNVAPALTVAPIGRPTRKCIKHIRGARKAIPGGILSSIMKWDPEKTELPMTEFFCGHDDLPGATVKAAFEYFMTALEICPMYCVPGTAETEKSTDGLHDLPINHGICLTNADAAAFGDEVKRLPIYVAQGINDRFDAENNLNAKICSRAKAFEEGWKGGKATSLIQKDADLNEEDHQKRIDEASDEAKTLDAEAKKGKGKRKEFRQEQKEFEKQAKNLNDKQEKLALKAQRKNAKAATAAAAYVAEVTGKIEAANKASADAEAAHEEALAELAAIQKELADEGETADADTKERLAKAKAKAEETAEALKEAKSALEAAHAELAKAKKDNEEKLAEIAKDYNDEVAALAAKAKEDQAAFDAEQQEHAAAVAEELKNNGLNAAAAQKQIAEEAADNKAAAKEEHDEIEDKYAKKEAAQEAAQAAWQAKADDDAKALAATRAATQAKFEAQEAADEAAYEKDMAHAGELQADADQAQEAYQDDVAAGEHEQEEADAMTKAELGYGNEIEECATGTQCLDATDMKCKNLDKTFCIAEDQFSCAPVPASGECNEFGAAPGAGLATYNVAPALTVAPIPHPSKACISHIKGAGDAIPGGILSEIMQWDPEHEELPMVKFFCGHDDLPGATVKAAFEYFMKALELCPMYCVPGSAETVKSTDGKEDLPINHGTCLTNADAAAFGDEVQKLPIYKAQGTNDRFDAANNLNDKICSRAKMFEEGWKGGQSTHQDDLKPSIQSMLHGHRFVVSDSNSTAVPSSSARCWHLGASSSILNTQYCDKSINKLKGKK